MGEVWCYSTSRCRRTFHTIEVNQFNLKTTFWNCVDMFYFQQCNEIQFLLLKFQFSNWIIPNIPVIPFSFCLRTENCLQNLEVFSNCFFRNNICSCQIFSETKALHGLHVLISSTKLDDDIYGSFSAAYLHNQKPTEQKVVISTLPVSINTVFPSFK